MTLRTLAVVSNPSVVGRRSNSEQDGRSFWLVIVVHKEVI